MSDMTVSPIMTLFRDWEATFAEPSKRVNLTNEEHSQLMDKCSDIEKRMLVLPSRTLADIAAKLIASTSYGGFMVDEDGPLIAEAKALVADGVDRPDVKLIELGRQFERTKAKARALDQARRRLFKEYETLAEAAGLTKEPKDNKAHVVIARRCGYRAASDAFTTKHGEVVKLMKAIHRTRATTLEGVAVKLEAVTFDLYDFELDPKGGDVAEIQLLRLCNQTRELVRKRGGTSCA